MKRKLQRLCLEGNLQLLTILNFLLLTQESPFNWPIGCCSGRARLSIFFTNSNSNEEAAKAEDGLRAAGESHESSHPTTGHPTHPGDLNSPIDLLSAYHFWMPVTNSVPKLICMSAKANECVCRKAVKLCICQLRQAKLYLHSVVASQISVNS